MIVRLVVKSSEFESGTRTKSFNPSKRRQPLCLQSEDGAHATPFTSVPAFPLPLESAAADPVPSSNFHQPTRPVAEGVAAATGVCVGAGVVVAVAVVAGVGAAVAGAVVEAGAFVAGVGAAVAGAAGRGADALTVN